MRQFLYYVSMFGGSCCAKMAAWRALSEPQPINCHQLPTTAGRVSSPQTPCVSSPCFIPATGINNQIVMDKSKAYVNNRIKGYTQLDLNNYITVSNSQQQIHQRPDLSISYKHKSLRPFDTTFRHPGTKLYYTTPRPHTPSPAPLIRFSGPPFACFSASIPASSCQNPRRFPAYSSHRHSPPPYLIMTPSLIID